MEMNDASDGRRRLFFPYDERNLDALPLDECCEAYGLVCEFEDYRFDGDDMPRARYDRLCDLNARGGMIRNTDGPAWLGEEGR